MLERYREVDPAQRTPAIFEAVRRGKHGLRGLYAELEALKGTGVGPGTAGAESGSLRDGFSLSSQGASALARDPFGGAGVLGPVVPAPRAAGLEPTAGSRAPGGSAPGALAPLAPIGAVAPATVTGAGAASAFVAPPGVPLAPPFPVGGAAVSSAPAAPLQDLETTRDELVEDLRRESETERHEREAEVLAAADRARVAETREVERGGEEARVEARLQDAADTDRAMRERVSEERMRSLEADQSRASEASERVLRGVETERSAVERSNADGDRVEQGVGAERASEEQAQSGRDEGARVRSAAEASSERSADQSSVYQRGEEERASFDGAEGLERAEERSEAGRAERQGDESRSESRREAGAALDAPTTRGGPAAEREGVAEEPSRAVGDPARDEHPNGAEFAYRGSALEEPESLLDDLYG